MEEPPKPATHTPQEIVNADTIQNLDTARMALRWALERMRTLGEEKEAVAQKAASEGRAAARAREEYSALQKTISLRGAEADQRELYYAKMEEFLSLQLGGKLDLAALAKRELEVQRLQELLQQKEVQLEKELAARRAALERDFEKLKTDAGSEARAKARQAEQALEFKRSTLETEYLSRLGEVHEKEIQLKHESQALAERQAHFEEYYSSQRAQLQSAVKNFRGEVDGQVEFRIAMAEKILTERYAGLDAAWTQEKTLLVKELETWRMKAREALGRALELEQALARAEESGKSAQAAADRQTIVLEEHRRAAQAEAAGLESASSLWREKASQQLAELFELKRQMGEAQERLGAVESAAQGAGERFEQARKAADLERAALASEAESWRQRFEQAVSRAQEEARGAAVLEEAVAQTKSAAEAQAGMLEERRLAWQQEKQVLLDELAQARGRHGEDAARVRDLEKRVERAAAAAAASAGEAERTAADRGHEKEALERRLRAASEACAQALDLEKRLGEAEAAEAAALRRAARLEEQRTLWERERDELLAEISGARRQAGEGLANLLSLERRLASSDEALRQVHAAGERQAARFDEQRTAWANEKAELYAKIDSLAPRTKGPL